MGTYIIHSDIRNVVEDGVIDGNEVIDLANNYFNGYYPLAGLSQERLDLSIFKSEDWITASTPVIFDRSETQNREIGFKASFNLANNGGVLSAEFDNYEVNTALSNQSSANMKLSVSLANGDNFELTGKHSYKLTASKTWGTWDASESPSEQYVLTYRNTNSTGTPSDDVVIRASANDSSIRNLLKDTESGVEDNQYYYQSNGVTLEINGKGSWNSKSESFKGFYLFEDLNANFKTSHDLEIKDTKQGEQYIFKNFSYDDGNKIIETSSASFILPLVDGYLDEAFDSEDYGPLDPILIKQNFDQYMLPYVMKGNNRIIGGDGDDALDAGEGLDTVVFSGSFDEYRFTKINNGWIVEDLIANRDGVDTLQNFELAQFSDLTTTLINAKPTSSNRSFKLLEDEIKFIDPKLFTFKDLDKADSLKAIQITALPQLGILKLGDDVVGENQLIQAADLARLNYAGGPDGFGKAYSSFKFKVSDGKEYSDLDYQINLEVAAVNDAPVVLNTLNNMNINVIAAQSINYTLPVNLFIDPDGDTLKLNAKLTNGNALPKWLKFNAKNGTFTGKPLDADAGVELNIRVSATDKAKATAFDDFQINVLDGGDQAPIAKAISKPLNLTEGRSFSYLLPKGTFVDPNKQDTLNFTISSNQPEWINIDQTTGKLTGTVSYAAADNGSLSLNIVATDTSGLSATTPLVINVKNVSTIKGTRGNDTIVAGNGNDTIISDLGNDLLTGGAGKDIFVFDKAIGPNNINTITDFSHEDDTIRLSKKIFNKIATKSSPNFTEDKFMSGDGATQATEASQRIILNTADGKLFYDADGLGGVDAVHFATINLAGVSSMNHTDFILA